jgi:hypothetical protein
MYWGSGPELGILSVFGSVVFFTGAVLFWRHRKHFSIWFQDEMSVSRRNLSRYTTIGPFYSVREDSRFKSFPSSFLHTLRRIPRSANRAAILVFTGLVLFVLDFLI